MSVTLSQFRSSSANAQFTVRILNEIFAAFPNRFRFTSGYRTALQNAAANGVRNSFHMTGEAGDFVPIDGRFPAGEREAIARLISRYGYEVIKHNAGSGLHYHIEPSPSGKRESVHYHIEPSPSGKRESVQPDADSGGLSGISTAAIAAGVVIFVLLATE